jgi:hypothetical protein
VNVILTFVILKTLFDVVVLSNILLNVVMRRAYRLPVILLGVIQLNVILSNVMAPLIGPFDDELTRDCAKCLWTN